MGQKVHPIGFRLGIYRDWDARWFSKKKDYGNNLLEDFAIRAFLEKSLEAAETARIEIEKAGDNIRIVIFAGRPGVIIGKKGQEIEALRSELARRLKKNHIEVSVQEVKKVELDAVLVAKSIATQLTKRGTSYKRVIKRSAVSSMKGGAKGIKICVSGRLGGAEIARAEWIHVGSVPLHTLRSDIDFGFAQAKTKYGIIGVRVWICRGEYQHIRRG